MHRSVKPQILSVFGDIALSIGPEFKKYLDVVLQTLHQASQAQVDRVCYFGHYLLYLIGIMQRPFCCGCFNIGYFKKYFDEVSFIFNYGLPTL